MNPAAGFDLDAGDPVPSAQLIERHAEPIRNRYQRIAPANRVKARMR